MNGIGRKCICLVLGLAVLGAAAQEAPRKESPVKFRLVSAGVMSDEVWGDGGLEESALKLSFKARLTIKEPWCFQQRAGAFQYLEMTDSTGRLLPPVEFNLRRILQYDGNDEPYAIITGTAVELPPPDAVWVRLKGVLRFPVARLVTGPVYELAPEKGIEKHVLLPESHEEETVASADIVVAGSPPSGRLFLDKCEQVEENGKKKMAVNIGLETDTPFELEAFQIVDARGEILKTLSRGSSSSVSDQSRKWIKYLRVETPENLSKIRVRMVYRVPVESVAVPIDMKVGMRGEIREEPEERGKRK